MSNIRVEGEPRLSRWLQENPKAADVIEMMTTAWEIYISWPMTGKTFEGMVNFPQQQALYHPDVPDPVVVYDRFPGTPPKVDPVYVVGSDGTVVDVRDLRQLGDPLTADELRRRMGLEGG